MDRLPSGPTERGEIFQQDWLEVWVSPSTNRTLRCVEDYLQSRGPFRMVGHAFRVDECSCNLHEDDGWHLASIHQLICSGVLGWHSDLQPDLGRAPPLHPTSPPNTVVAQIACQFGEVHFWHNLGSIPGIHYWWKGGACWSNQDPSHSGLANPNHSNRAL